MIEAIKLADFAEKNGWIVIDKREIANNENFIRYLTPQGQIVFVGFYDDGSIHKVVVS